MSGGYLFFVFIGLITPFVVSKHVQFYRKDYTYIQEYDAFYKVHWDVNGWSWSSAFSACDDEGSKLFYPSGNEWTIVKNLTDAMAVAPNTSEIYVGLHDEFNLGEFITVDGTPTESPLNAEGDIVTSDGWRCLVMDFTTGLFKVSECSRGPEYPTIPFVCKKADDESCPTIDHEYKYMKSTKKCYKVNNRPKTWQAAMQTCFMQGGMLAVLERGADVPEGIEENHYYFVGFRKMFSSPDFYTVKGKQFENYYFKSWYNSVYERRDEDCGVMKYYNQEIKMESQKCSALLPFICEMETKSS